MFILSFFCFEFFEITLILKVKKCNVLNQGIQPPGYNQGSSAFTTQNSNEINKVK